MEIKHGLIVLSGVALFFFGAPHLPIESRMGLSAVFSLTWPSMLLFHILANIRQMKRISERKKRRREALRRLQWLEAEQEWKRRKTKMRRVKSVSV